MDILGIYISSMLTLWTLEASCRGHMVDLSHTINSRAIHWPLFRDFEKKVFTNTSTPEGLWIFTNELTFNEHTGTHVDAPVHSWLGGKYLHQVALEDLMGPLVVIDCKEQVKQDRDYTLLIKDVLDYEMDHGRIADGGFVFMNTGGYKVYHDANQYLGSNTTNDTSTLHFPGFDSPVVIWLVQNRNIKGIGLDRVSLDGAQVFGGRAHKALLSRGKIGIENLNNLDKVPPNGASVIIMPMNVEGGSGAPARVLAFWGEGSPFSMTIASNCGKTGGVWVAIILTVLVQCMT